MMHPEPMDELWHHGVMNRESSERMLKSKPINSWLVRLSDSTHRNVISKKIMELNDPNTRYSADPTSSLAKNSIRFSHYKIQETEDGFFYLKRQQRFFDVLELIDFYKEHPCSPGVMEGLSVDGRQTDRPPLLSARLQVSRNIMNASRRNSMPYYGAYGGGDSDNGRNLGKPHLDMSEDVEDEEETDTESESESEQEDEDEEESQAASNVETVVVFKDQGGSFYSTVNKPSLLRQKVTSADSNPEPMVEMVSEEKQESYEKVIDELKDKLGCCGGQNGLQTNARQSETKTEKRQHNDSEKIDQSTDKIYAKVYKTELVHISSESTKADVVSQIRQDMAAIQLEMQVAKENFNRMESRFKKLTTAVSVYLNNHDASPLTTKTSQTNGLLPSCSPMSTTRILTPSIPAGHPFISRPPIPEPGCVLVAIAPYAPSYFDELELTAGSEITFLSELDPGWWKGRQGDKVGTFPSNFVRQLSEKQ